MKRALFFVLFVISFSLPLSGLAQTEATTIQSLTIDLWPDFDRASVLVLLTGNLPAGASLPATITLPLPDDAQLNAVARIDSNDVMIDDIEYNRGQESLTFTTPDTHFRVEYYFPYTADNNQRAFTFTWLSDLSVDQLDVTVQQPALASSLITEPAATVVGEGNDGLNYHALPGQTISAGDTFSVKVNYTMEAPQLSAEAFRDNSEAQTADSATSPAAPALVTSPGFNWPILIAGVGGLLIIIALVWQIATNRAATKPHKPRPARRVQRKSQPGSQRNSKPTSARFCHECGQPVEPQDQFCRQCGTAVKGKM